MSKNKLLALLSVFGGAATAFLALLMLFVGDTRFELWAGYATLVAGGCAFIAGLVMLAHGDDKDEIGKANRK